MSGVGDVLLFGLAIVGGLIAIGLATLYYDASKPISEKSSGLEIAGGGVVWNGVCLWNGDISDSAWVRALVWLLNGGKDE
jgi:hypothetical protein